MIDFKQARECAFETVKNTRIVEKVSEEVKNRTGGTTIREFWLVTIEVPMEDHIRDVILEVSLKPDFPLSLPVIKLSEADFEQTKYLPHVDSRRSICLYDQENIKLNTDDPAGVVNECINQAVRILSDGLNKDRVAEFNDEIIAYWENTYHKNDVVVEGYLGSNMVALQPGNVPAHYLVEPHATVNLYIGNKLEETEKLTGFFKLRGHTIQEFDAFYLGELEELSPPFYYDNKSLLAFIKFHFSGIWNELKPYLNRSNNLSKLLVFSVVSGGKSVFFGFYLHSFKVNFNGWRTGQSTVQVMANIRPTEAVKRVRFAEFHPDRLQVRTDGGQQGFTAKKIMLAGLGSIGSNLLLYLSALEISKYVLVDPEILTLENINRHLLSFNEVGMKKVDAIAKYIKFHNPFADIQKHVGSLVDLIQHRLAEINELDLIFCAIGKDMIESYILQYLTTGAITKPVLLFWVEPYLLGAHVLYIRPGTSFSLNDLEVDGIYKFNILSTEAYKDPSKKLSLREAGCQGSYMPYGQSEIVQFFAALIPTLFNIIEMPPSNNLAITYVGDLNTATTLTLPISNFASSFKSRQVFVQSI
jgi:hypothetical protein